MKPLTPTQEKLLSYIKRRFTLSGKGPSYSEMREHMEVASNEAITSWLNALEQKGYIRKEPGKIRAIIPVNTNSSLKDEADTYQYTVKLGADGTSVVKESIPLLATNGSAFIWTSGMEHQDSVFDILRPKEGEESL